ncbi:MAG: hypothetical protein LBJ62_09085 [Bifidobacteriaceae bacterium]|jgi:plasmid stability protein|nr:hypothetical protein [Bifidobacteriaceae bacterium]
MAVLTVRSVPDEVHRALRVPAAGHGRSAEAEVREILSAALVPSRRLLLGDALAALGRDLALTDDDLAALGRDTRQDPGGADDTAVIVLDTNVVSEAMRPLPTADGHTAGKASADPPSPRSSPASRLPDSRERAIGRSLLEGALKGPLP